MSKNDAVGSIQHDLRHMSNEDIETTYGINLNEDGTVYDPAYDRTFNNVREWAEFETEYDDIDYSDDLYHSKHINDDFY